MLSNDDVCIVLVEKIHLSQTVILSGYIDFVINLAVHELALEHRKVNIEVQNIILLCLTLLSTLLYL
jgi:hypothetical protein